MRCPEGRYGVVLLSIVSESLYQDDVLIGFSMEVTV